MVKSWYYTLPNRRSMTTPQRTSDKKIQRLFENDKSKFQQLMTRQKWGTLADVDSLVDQFYDNARMVMDEIISMQ
ncbi:hypothetical protein HHI36_005014, partial [Cryptolaemus montrouzieri]